MVNIWFKYEVKFPKAIKSLSASIGIWKDEKGEKIVQNDLISIKSVVFGVVEMDSRLSHVFIWGKISKWQKHESPFNSF